ncbi:MAG: U32 family peptidase, partial [Spirochaetaceae bacterium]|nr:U32 family peptidase [Spirochaetaceae bacterium]
MSNVELLAPCGSLESLNAAASEGADAVYLGLKSFNARIRSSNFAYSEFEAALNAMHRQGRKVYVAVNTVFIDRESDRIFQLLQYLWRTGADGIIVQDFGVLKICTENFPSLKLHASTQMNVSCAKACNLLSKAGVTRCVLSRELSFEELKSIRAASNIELEIFVHGALCVSASGLCLFSSCLGGKSANRGMCTQACRRLYTEDIDHMELAKGKFYFSPLDLQLIEKIPSLAEAGINAFKIEGRMKSAEYVGTVVRAYRKVIDSLGGDTETAISAAIEILKTDYARGKTLFHFNGRNAPRENNEDFWLSKDADGGTGIKLGAIVQVRGEGEDKCALIKCDVVLSSGDSIRVHSADDSVRQSFKLGAIEERNRNEYWINIPELIEQSNEDAKPAKNISAKSFTVGDSVYLIQTKANSRHYTPVIRKNFLHSQRKPGFDKAPLVK